MLGTRPFGGHWSRRCGRRHGLAWRRTDGKKQEIAARIGRVRLWIKVKIDELSFHYLGGRVAILLSRRRFLGDGV